MPWISLPVLFVASTVLALPDHLYVKKINYPGLVDPDTFILESCSLYADRVVIEHQYGTGESQVVATEVRNLQISGDLASLVEVAVAGTLEETENNICDLPGTVVTAHKLGGNSMGQALFQTGGCGTPQMIRHGAAAYKLRAWIDLYCPVTHQLPAEP